MSTDTLDLDTLMCSVCSGGEHAWVCRDCYDDYEENRQRESDWTAHYYATENHNNYCTYCKGE